MKHTAHLRQQCQNSKLVIFQEKSLKVLKRYAFLWTQWRHNCSPAASFTNCVMTLYLLEVHLQTFLSIPITQKCQILSRDILVASERYVLRRRVQVSGSHFVFARTVGVEDYHLETNVHFSSSGVYPIDRQEVFRGPSVGILPFLARYCVSFTTVVPQPHLWYLYWLCLYWLPAFASVFVVFCITRTPLHF